MSELRVLSTGIPGVDRILRGLLPGDNIVWQVSSIQDYLHFAQPFAKFAADRSLNLVYFRFASHEPLLDESAFPRMRVCRPDPRAGFEPFIAEIHAIIKQNGRGGYYVFDSLSELTEHWYSDRMLGNFFMLTCPYLLDMEALAYFAVIKGEHSRNALYPIHTTAQIILDTYNRDGIRYMHPLKVQQRYSPTMHMLHEERGELFVPVTNSAVNSDILSFSPFRSGDDAFEEMDRWNRLFAEARAFLESDKPDGVSEPDDFGEPGDRACGSCSGGHWQETLLSMAVTRDEKMRALAREYLPVRDLLEIGRRMIGTGLIGGKSTGMLLARAVIARNAPGLAARLERHDSFYVGSDVFYTYMVVNGCWWIRHQQKDIDAFLSVAEYARRVILTGSFPGDIVRKLSDMLDYFGQSPIIVRSSSLLEDNFGNAFSGKYESVFCPNQGSRETRLENLLTAIKTIYASTLSEKALHYRSRLGILDKDEQMPLLIQRVSGDLHGSRFYPAAAGVGYSYNPFVWDPEIDPESGVLRIVYGMGTRAVDRSDTDYTRIASLGCPEKRPETGIDEIRRYSQRLVDLLDLEANQLVSVRFDDIADSVSNEEIELLTAAEPAGKSTSTGWLSQFDGMNFGPTYGVSSGATFSASGASYSAGRFISFDGLFQNTPFAQDMRLALKTLEKAYTHPVDIEFTVNLTGGGAYRVNIVQCRPFEARRSNSFTLDAPGSFDGSPAGQFSGSSSGSKPPLVLMESSVGTVIGRSREVRPDRIIFVPPQAYADLPVNLKYQTARTIGLLMKQSQEGQNVVLAGPGRWGTTTVFLGIPVTFSEISGAACVCEIVQMSENFIPDVSLGTHFFNDLVEFDILYLALYPGRSGTVFRPESLLYLPNRFSELLSDAESRKLENVIRVIDLPPGNLVLGADTLAQKWRLSFFD